MGFITTFLSYLGRKVLVTIGGLAVCIAWWTLTGDDGVPVDVMDRVPDAVHGGGGGTIEIALEASHAATFEAHFGPPDEENGKVIESKESIAAGRHVFTTDVASGGSIYYCLQIEDPPVGARVAWTVKLNGRTVVEESEELEKPLRAGYAFGLVLDLDGIEHLQSVLDDGGYEDHR